MIRRLAIGVSLALLCAGLSLLAPSRAQIGPIPGMAVLPPPQASASCGTPVATNIGTAANATGATLTLTGVTVPAGSLIVAVISEFDSGTSALGSLADGVNTYSLASSQTLDNSASEGILGVYYAPNAGLSSGTITYTRHTSGQDAWISAFYATNILASSPLDSAVTATGFGAANSPTLTSGTPAQSGELFVAGFAVAATSVTFAQDATNGWSAPPNATSVFSSQITAGGSQVNSGTGTKTYHPTTTGTSAATASIILGFKHC